MNIEVNVLSAIDDYHEKSLTCQQFYFEGNKQGWTKEQLRAKINDDLVFHVPIYDVLDRRYASFSSFPEALHKRHLDPKGHGPKFAHHDIEEEIDWLTLLYWFRLCGSGINYKPGSHGFGNFWVVDAVRAGAYNVTEWLELLPESKFCDNKGYLLPQFKKGLRNFIIDDSLKLVSFLHAEVAKHKHSIIEFVDKGNAYLNSLGFQKQNFVLSAFAADIAEYFPKYVDPFSMIYAGTNAKKCIKAIFGPGTKEHRAIEFLSDRYETVPYSIEDSRLCDPVRYFLDYQSKFHIEANSGKTYKNNSILKKIWTPDEYQSFQSRLQK